MCTKNVNLEYFNKFEAWARVDERVRITAALTPLLMKMGDDAVASEIFMYLRQTYPLPEPETNYTPKRRASGYTEDTKAAALKSVHDYLREGRSISRAFTSAAADNGMNRGTLMRLWYCGGREDGKPSVYN